MSSLAQVTSSISSHERYALRRQSSIHAGSFFLPEMKRTVSSLSPFGANSCSISETKPHSYSASFSAASCASRLRTVSTTLRLHCAHVERVETRALTLRQAQGERE